VSEAQMVALFGLGLHPNADAIMAARRREHVTAWMSERHVARVNERARKAAALGRPFPTYADLGPFDVRVAARLAAIWEETGREPTEAEEKKVKREEARRPRRAVAGFDLVFTPVASVSRLWGLDPRLWVREAIEQAHFAARNAALRLLEEHAAHSRTGSSGQAQIETRGLIAAVFEHADNRLGEPNLHSHVAISSKVLGLDGKWRALDARGLYRITVAASELYNTRLEQELHTRLGLRFEARPDTLGKREPVREIKGFPSEVLAHFTRRRAGIGAEYAHLVAEFRAEHGREPDLAAAHALAQQATLATRTAKKPARAWAAMLEEWRAELADAFGPLALAAVTALVPDRRDAEASKLVRVGDLDVSAAARRVVDAVQEHHATWTRWTVVAQVQRELRGVYFANTEEQECAVERVVDEALSTWSLSVEPPDLLTEPAALQRSDGTPVFTQHAAARFTSRVLLDAEARLVDATKTATTVGVDGPTAVAALAAHELAAGRFLDAGQRALVESFACDGRLLLAGIGPAGAGKTSAMRALAAVIKAYGGGRLVPLATSASAAAVLAEELGTPAENLHKFLWEWRSGPYAKELADGRMVPSEIAPFVLREGDVVLVDEAGMAGTLNLDRLVQIAARQGAVVRLLGDYRQLGAVESGGALRLIAAESGAVELSTLYRFANPVEAEATLKIRVGDTSGLDFYQAHGRIRHGSRQGMTEAVYRGWRADMVVGRTAVMVAATNADVAELCARARADRVTVGQVEQGGVRLHDGTLAGVGDWIVTRENYRRLRAGIRDFVKNGDAWRVLERRDDGGLLVEHLEHRGRVVLPSAYVMVNVELLYATTAHRAQGTTVDAAHALVTEEMGRENFYVSVSRARYGTTLYAATHELGSVDEDEYVDALRFDPDAYAAREILEHVVARETAEISATEQIAVAYAEAESLSTLVPQYAHALDVATDGHYRRLVEHVLPDLANEIVADPAWHAVQRALRDADAAGWDTPVLLHRAARQREIGSAQSAAQVLVWRLRRVIDHEQPVILQAATAPVDAERYRSILDALAPDLVAQIPPAARNPVAARIATGALSRERDYLSALHATLGTVRANRARNEAAWPTLLLALRRADELGYEPADVLRAAANRRAMRTAASVSETFALSIHRYLAGCADEDSAEPRAAWVRIVRSLAQLERTGTHPTTGLSRAVDAVALGPVQRSLAGLAEQLCEAVRAEKGPSLPAWMHAAPRVDDPQWRSYVDARVQLIHRRISDLTDTAATTRPAWTERLGETPADPAEREQWLRHLGVLSAYRDQYKVTDDDPEHPLGPYPERGRTGHQAYWISAASLLALRGTVANDDAAVGRLAADHYRTLPGREQARIATEMVERLGVDWLGDPGDPAADVDQPVYRDHLATVLIERGHLHNPAASETGTPSVRGLNRSTLAKQRRTQRSAGIQPRCEPKPAEPRATEPVRQPSAPVQRAPRMPSEQPRGPSVGGDG
jgi:conjugative relaxase-like TrwC/TraI family protein